MRVQISAMHMSDGIVTLPTSILFALVAIVVLAVCIWRARSELDDRAVPLAGLLAAFIFAVQMINFPIFPGVSGHLLGGALAAILAGPYVGALCVAIVVVVQSLLFADGGVSALGTNITNMALIGVAVGYCTARGLYILVSRASVKPQSLSGTPSSVKTLGIISFVAAMCATVCASLGFVVEYGIGGAVPVSLGALAITMTGAHILVGIGEGIITAVTVMAVARTRPDLVYLLHRRRVTSQVLV